MGSPEDLCGRMLKALPESTRYRLELSNVHQVEETAKCALWGGCCCCNRWAYSFPDHVQVRGSAHFHVWSPYFWWL